jgi:hypothetical protein
MGLNGSGTIIDPSTQSTIIEFQLRKHLGFTSVDFITMTQREVMMQYECLKIQNEIDARNAKK